MDQAPPEADVATDTHGSRAECPAEPPIRYGDVRMTTERDHGKTCLFWVGRLLPS